MNSFIFSFEAYADSPDLIRKVVVFPIKAPKQYSTASEKTWWAIRDSLTRNKRFQIASRQFMIRKDVMQAREEMEAAQAILLGKLLEGHALLTTYLDGRALHMQVYSGTNGLMLWKRQTMLHPSQPISDQLEKVAVKLVQDFMASIPYQGFQIVDALKDKPVYEEVDKKLAKVQVAVDHKIEIGDQAQWIHISGSSPLYQKGGKVSVIAEGVVVNVEQDILTIEIKRLQSIEDLKKDSLVRFPKEADRLETQYAFVDGIDKMLKPEMLASELNLIQTDNNETKALATTGSTIVSILVFILLAF